MSVFSWLTQKLNGVESVVDSDKIKYSSDMTDTDSVKDKIDALNSDLKLKYFEYVLEGFNYTANSWVRHIVPLQTGETSQVNRIAAVAKYDNQTILSVSGGGSAIYAMRTVSGTAGPTIRVYYYV